MQKKLLILVAFCLIISAPIQKTSAQDTEQEVMNIDNNDLEENPEEKLNSEEKAAEVEKKKTDYKSSEKDKNLAEDLTEGTEKPTVGAVEETEKLDDEENSKELKTSEKIEKDNLKKNNYELSPRGEKKVAVKNVTEFKNAFNDANVTEIKITKEVGELSIAPGQLNRTNARPLTIDLSGGSNYISSLALRNVGTEYSGAAVTLTNSDLTIKGGTVKFVDYHTLYKVNNSQLTLSYLLIDAETILPVAIEGSIRGPLKLSELEYHKREGNPLPARTDKSLFKITSSEQKPLTIDIPNLRFHPVHYKRKDDLNHYIGSIFDFSQLDTNISIDIKNVVDWRANGMRTFIKGNGNNIKIELKDFLESKSKPNSFLENVGDIQLIGLPNEDTQFDIVGSPLLINTDERKSKIKIQDTALMFKDFSKHDWYTKYIKIDNDISQMDVEKSKLVINQEPVRRTVLNIPEINIKSGSEIQVKYNKDSHKDTYKPIDDHLIKTEKINIVDSEVILEYPVVGKGVFNVDLTNGGSNIKNTKIKIHDYIDRWGWNSNENMFDDFGFIFSFSSSSLQPRTMNFSDVEIEHKNPESYKMSKLGLFEANAGDIVVNLDKTSIDYVVYYYQNMFSSRGNAKLTLQTSDSDLKFRSVGGGFEMGDKTYPFKPFVGGNNFALKVNSGSNVDIQESLRSIMTSENSNDVNKFELYATKGSKLKIGGGGGLQNRMPLFENVILKYDVNQPEDIDIRHEQEDGPVFQLAPGNHSTIEVTNSNFEVWDYLWGRPNHDKAPYEDRISDPDPTLGYGGSHTHLKLEGDNFETITADNERYALEMKEIQDPKYPAGPSKPDPKDWNPISNKSRIRSYNPTPIVKGLFPIQDTHRYINAKVEVPIDATNPRSHMRPAYTGEVFGVISVKDKEGNIELYEDLITKADYLQAVPWAADLHEIRDPDENKNMHYSRGWGTFRVDLTGDNIENIILANLDHVYTVESARSFIGKEAIIAIDENKYKRSAQPTRNTPPTPVKVDKAFEGLNYITGRVGSSDTTKIEVYEGVYSGSDDSVTLVDTIQIEENQEKFIFELPDRDLVLGEKFTFVAYNEVRGNPFTKSAWHDAWLEPASQGEVVENPYIYEGNHRAFYIDDFQLNSLEDVAEEIDLKVIEKATNQEVVDIELENRDALNFSDIEPGLYSFRAKLFDEDGDVYYSPIYRILIYDQKKVKEVGNELLIADDFHGNTKTHEIREEKLLKEKARAYAFNLDTGFLQELIFERTKLNEFKENGAEPDEYDLRVKHPDQDTFYLDIKAYIYDYDYVVETVDNLLLANDFVGYAHELPQVIDDDYILTMSSAKGYSKNRYGSLKPEEVEVVDHNVRRAVDNYKAHLRVKMNE